MIEPNKIIEAARKYLDTPYRNQGRDNFGLDCGGFCVLVFRDLGVEISDITGYRSYPDGETFEKILTDHCEEIEKDSTQIGDILGFELQKGGVSHIAILSQITPYLKILHCTNYGVRTGVVEHRLMRGTDFYRKWIRAFRIK